MPLEPGRLQPPDMDLRQWSRWCLAQILGPEDISVDTLSALSADMGDITAGNITLAEFIAAGQTAFDTGTGFYLEYNAGTPRLSIGDSAGNKMTWDGSTLTVTGTINLQANAVAESNIQNNAVTAGKISVTDLAAISADLGTITAGNITLAEFIRAGQTAYDTGTGFYLEYNGGTPRFSIGDGTTKLTWDGSTLTITYADGTTIEALKPAEASADVTGDHAADVDVLDTINAPAEADADVTGTNTAADVAAEEDTHALSLTGFTTAKTLDLKSTRTGGTVVLTFTTSTNITGTLSTGALTTAALPAALRPAVEQFIPFFGVLPYSTAIPHLGLAIIGTSGVITFYACDTFSSGGSNWARRISLPGSVAGVGLASPGPTITYTL